MECNQRSQLDKETLKHKTGVQFNNFPYHNETMGLVSPELHISPLESSGTSNIVLYQRVFAVI